MTDSHDVENAASPTHSAAPADSSTDDVLDIIADVEGRLERLRKVSKESGAVVDSIHQKQAALDKRQAELDQRGGELQQAVAALQQRTAELDEREKHVESLCELADTERRELDQVKHSIEADRTALAQEREAVEQQRTAVNGEREQLAAAQAEHRANAESLEASREQLKQQLASLQEQRDRCEQEHRTAMQAVDQRLDEITRSRDERGEQLQAQLDEARKQITALKEHLESARAESSRTEQAHKAELEQAALRADSLQADLDAAQGKASELEAALRKANADLKARCEQLDAAKRKLMELGKALDAQAEQIQTGTAALAALEDRDRRIAELESQLAAAPVAGASAGVDPAELAARDQRIAGLEQEIESLKAQVQAAADAASNQGDSTTGEELAQRDQRIAALEEEVKSLEARLQAAAQSGSNPAEASSEELARRDQAIEDLSNHIRSMQQSLKTATAETAQREAEIAQLKKAIKQNQAARQPATGDDGFTALRRQRLQRMRKAIRDRSQRLNKARDVVKQQAHQARGFDDERRTLQDVRRNLELAEQRMIRRWARSSAVTNLFLMVLTISILGAASYFGVMTFWPTAYTAHATIEAKGKPGFPLTANQINLWQTVHEQMLMSDAVVNGIAERLRQRGYTDLAEPANLRTFLEANLVIGSPEPGTINLELTATGRDEVQRLLETYSIGLVSASNAERGRRTDGATTNLAVPATVDALPAKDNRVQIAGIAFGSSVSALLLLGLPMYLKLRRSASVFEDDDLDGPMMDQTRWDQISKGSQATEHVIS